MNRTCITQCAALLLGCACACRSATAATTAPSAPPAATATLPAPDLERLRQERRSFQQQDPITARPFTFIFNPNEPPRIVWRDVEEVARLGGGRALRVRWFDRDLNEVATPTRPGRWAAYVEGRAPNGTPLRRAMTFYCRPPGFFMYIPPVGAATLPHQPGPVAPDVWREHQEEIDALVRDGIVRALGDSEAGAVLIAGLTEAPATGREPRATETAAARSLEFQLAVKLKAQGLAWNVRPLAPPRQRAGPPAAVLRTGTAAEAGVGENAKSLIDAVCRAWAADTGEPFVTLVARRGIIVTHEAFGRDARGRAVTRDYRADVASITKSATAVMFARFVEQGSIGLDDRASGVFPDYPSGSPRVPTFRQCLTHMSGLSGHGEFQAAANPHLENVILNAIDVNEPGKEYIYSGMGFDLTAKAMEIVSGKSFVRLYHEDLFRPLGMGEVPMGSASSGAQFTARQLATLGQLLLNRGSYGDREFFSAGTFERMLPEDLGLRYPGVTEVEGIGLHWMKVLRPGAAAGSDDGADRLLSRRTIGHGSLSGCMFLMDLERDLLVVQVRRQLGPRHAEWAAKFHQTIADGLR